MFTSKLSTKLSAKFSVVVVPVAALVFALTPTMASADTGGPVLVIAPNASILAGVEVAGAMSSGGMFSCSFSASSDSVQTCVLPAGTGPADALVAAPNASDGDVAVAGVTVSATGAASYTCEFDISASGPQTCSINS
jgi:hypothetical protein